jgi:hypothetical protein
LILQGKITLATDNESGYKDCNEAQENTMHIEDLTAEIECSFREIPLEYIPARIAELEGFRDCSAKRLTRTRERLAAGKKIPRHQLRYLRQEPSFIRRMNLIIRALREGYAYRTA